jgi:hypothetical protein
MRREGVIFSQGLSDLVPMLDQHRTPTPISRLAVTGNFGNDLSLITGKFAGSAVKIRCVLTRAKQLALVTL